MQHLNSFLNKEVTLQQVKSGLKLNQKQKGNLVGLGLRGVGSSSKLKCTECVIGMIKKVNHLIKISL